MNRISNYQVLVLPLLLFLTACPIKFDGAGLGEESSAAGNITVNSSFNTYEFPTSDNSTLDTSTDALVITDLDSDALTTGSLTFDTFESTSTSTSTSSNTSSDSDFDSTENRASTGGMIPPTFGGIQKADEYCQNDANKFGIPGIFRAWISDSNPKNDPVERFGDFLTFNGWYRLPSDPPKPVSKGAKFQFGLSVPIDIMPMGSKDLVVESVWTNTKPDGKAYDYINNCNNWTSNSPSLTYAGSPHSINSEWTLYGWKNCSSGVGSKLYCFETNQ